MLLLIDNYDSFVHNLARYFERLGQETHVLRNDEVSVTDVRAMKPRAMVLSPGPCTPREAGASLEIVRSLHAEVPMLGVCLGHQVIAEALGARVVRAAEPVHGRVSHITHDGSGLFDGLSTPLAVGRYHSLVVDPESLPSSLRPTAHTQDGILMAFEHVRLPVAGVQFHPESILTEFGYHLLSNFLRMAGTSIGEDPRELGRHERTERRVKRAPLPTRPVTF